MPPFLATTTQSTSSTPKTTPGNCYSEKNYQSHTIDLYLPV